MAVLELLDSPNWFHVKSEWVIGKSWHFHTVQNEANLKIDKVGNTEECL